MPSPASSSGIERLAAAVSTGFAARVPLRDAACRWTGRGRIGKTVGRAAPAAGACVAAGWTTEGACAVLEVDRRRVWRWQCRRDTGVGLDDRASGGNAIHGLLGWEIDEILALAEEWGPIDRSHRKLAHRGSYLKRVWVAPSTVRRVLASHDVDLPAAVPQPTRPERKPRPDWVEYRPR
jgi:putative transposase